MLLTAPIKVLFELKLFIVKNESLKWQKIQYTNINQEIILCDATNVLFWQIKNKQKKMIAPFEYYRANANECEREQSRASGTNLQTPNDMDFSVWSAGQVGTTGFRWFSFALVRKISNGASPSLRFT